MRSDRPTRRAPVAPGRPRPATALLQGIRVPGLAIATLVLLVFAIAVLAPQLSGYLVQRQHIADLRAEVAAQKRDLAGLHEQEAQWSDPAYIRSQAGSRLFYVLPGEATYRVLGAAASDALAAPPSATVTQTPTDWAATLLGSLIVAGVSTSAPSRLTTAGAAK